MQIAGRLLRSECSFCVNLGWYFTSGLIRVVTMHQITTWPETFPFWACISTVLQVAVNDASTIPSLSLSISTCSRDSPHRLGLTTIARNRTFLPAPDLRLPSTRQGKALSHHHLEGRGFTCKNTQLLRYNDLNRSSPALSYRFERTDALFGIAAKAQYGFLSRLRAPPVERVSTRFLSYEFIHRLPPPRLRPPHNHHCRPGCRR